MSAADYRERWTPVRYVNAEQECDFCWEKIPKGAPGSKTGTRGTRAWFNPDRRVWECLRCRSAGFEAETVRETLEAAQSRSVAASARGA